MKAAVGANRELRIANGGPRMRSLFIALSANRQLRRFAERGKLGLRLSRRFVAGTTIADALAAARAVNTAGMAVSLDNLGENVTDASEARRSASVDRKS